MHNILIGGAWTAAQDGPQREILNPATLEPLGCVAECGAGDLARAVAAAHEAAPAWRGVPPSERAALLGGIGARIRAGERELAILLMQESGQPLCEARDCIAAAASVFEARAAQPALGTTQEAPPGVLAAILASDFPPLLLARAVARAIGSARPVIVKPPHENPLACLKLAEAFDALPAGVVNVVTGGAQTSRSLIEDPALRQHLDPRRNESFVVCQDVDLEVTVPGIAWQRLRQAGQCGHGPKHIYVARGIASEFIERMHYCVGFLDVDDPCKRSTDVGPLLSREAAQRVEDQVGRALRGGAKLILGGRRFRPSGLAGHFFQPTILADVRPGNVATREAIFGPVVTVTPVADACEALKLASEAALAAGAREGVGAAIYTSDVPAALAALAPYESGTFRINDPQEDGPLDGVRPGNRSANPRAVRVAEKLERKPWWFPYVDRR